MSHAGGRPPLVPENDFKEHVWPYDLPHRGAGVGGRARQGSETNSLPPTARGKSKANPTSPLPDRQFRWFRSRIVGGRTNHWGRIALRYGSGRFQGLAPPMAWATTGPSPTKKFRPTTIRSSPTSASSERKRIFPARPTEFFCRRPAALHRNHHQEGLRPAEHSLRPFTAGDPDPAPERTSRLPLLRAMRPGMHHRFELQFQPGHDSSRGEATGRLTLITGAMARESSSAKMARQKPSPTSTRPRGKKNGSTPGPSSLRRAPANPHACC